LDHGLQLLGSVFIVYDPGKMDGDPLRGHAIQVGLEYTIGRRDENPQLGSPTEHKIFLLRDRLLFLL
jgi:hypothetical protein